MKTPRFGSLFCASSSSSLSLSLLRPCSLDSTTHATPALFISPCHHFFHTECIVGGWIQQQSKEESPYCRQPLWDKAIYEEIRGQVALELYKDTCRETNAGRIDDEAQQQHQQQPEDNISSVAVDYGEETIPANITSLESRRRGVEEGASRIHVQDEDEEQGHLATTIEATDEHPGDEE